MFMARKLEIDAMLQRLTEFSANHFGVDPEDVDWGHVGTLGHYATPAPALRQCFSGGRNAV